MKKKTVEIHEERYVHIPKKVFYIIMFPIALLIVPIIYLIWIIIYHLTSIIVGAGVMLETTVVVMIDAGFRKEFLFLNRPMFKEVLNIFKFYKRFIN